jgi:hypothetical protein
MTESRSVIILPLSLQPVNNNNSNSLFFCPFIYLFIFCSRSSRFVLFLSFLCRHLLFCLWFKYSFSLEQEEKELVNRGSGRGRAVVVHARTWCLD